MKRLSLRVRLVLFVLLTMMMASAFTSAFYAFLFLFGFLPVAFFSGLSTPIYTLIVSNIIGASISALIARQFLRPTRDLIEATRLVSKGDFSVRLTEDERYGEMNELMRSFNHMTQELGNTELFRKDFINNFSHEFKTPMVSIRGFARQLQREDLTPEQRREYTDIIISESERLANMAGNILLLTKLENQTIISEKTRFRLDEALRTALLLLEKDWSQKNLELSLSLEETWCVGNDELLSHVWQNLLSNAIKFSPDGGELSLVCLSSPEGVWVRVGNQGEGMDEETLKRIFEKFYQGDSSHSSRGNGLGLPLAKRIVELSGGSIHAESSIGMGAVFTVRLPADDTSSDKALQKKGTSNNG